MLSMQLHQFSYRAKLVATIIPGLFCFVTHPLSPPVFDSICHAVPCYPLYPPSHKQQEGQTNRCINCSDIIGSSKCARATCMLSMQFHKFFIGQSWQLPLSLVCFVSQHVPSPLWFLTAFVKLLPVTPCIHPAANSKGKQIGASTVPRSLDQSNAPGRPACCLRSFTSFL